MKNKVILKKCIIRMIIASILFITAFVVVKKYEYRRYIKNYNDKIAVLVDTLQSKYPNLSKDEILSILNNDNDTQVSSSVLDELGIDLESESVLIENDSTYTDFLSLEIGLLVFAILVIVFIFMIYNRHKDNDIKNITKCIEQINRKNYELNLDSMSEDELSILKNEIYKTTIILKETAEHSLEDKKNLKKSLEDISHQLKTPLTSILVILDSFIDDPDMEASVRNDFVMDIKREIVNISFLVQSLLKLSKFDANTIKYIIKDTYASDLINDAIKNVSALCDLRNITIEKYGSGSEKMRCDYRWQLEAVTNILKNAIDHSEDNQKVIIVYEQGKVYSKIEIKDFGEGISEKDMKHIFERFYKGENSKSDSVGIGLSLAKTIIENDNGQVSVESNENETVFTIKYFNI